MKRTLSGALFSAAFCAISASVYFTINAAVVTHAEASLGIVTGFVMIAEFAIPIAGTFGLVLGLFGAWLLPHLPFVTGRSSLVAAAAVVGGILGCIAPTIPRILPPANPGNSEILGLSFVPCVAIGILCAVTWALLFSIEILSQNFH